MRPVSTFSMMTVIGSALPGGTSLNSSKLGRGMRVLAEMDNTGDSQPEKSSITVISYAKNNSSYLLQISPMAQRLAEAYLPDHSTSTQKTSLSGSSSEIGSRRVEEENIDEYDVEDDPRVKQARQDEAILKVGFRIVDNLHKETEREKIRDLEERDKKVRQREEAHQRAAGSLAAGSPVYKYEIGPDGKRYAVEGHTEIKIREGRTAEERLKNARQAEKAANASGEVTPQSMRIAFEARQEAKKAQKEIDEHNRSDNPENKGRNNVQLTSQNWQQKAAHYAYSENLDFYIQSREILD